MLCGMGENPGVDATCGLSLFYFLSLFLIEFYGYPFLRGDYSLQVCSHHHSRIGIFHSINAEFGMPLAELHHSALIFNVDHFAPDRPSCRSKNTVNRHLVKREHLCAGFGHLGTNVDLV